MQGWIQSNTLSLPVRCLRALLSNDCLHPAWRLEYYWQLLCSGCGGCHSLGDMCNTRIVQQKWRGGILTLDCRGYGTPNLRGIPLASLYRNASLSKGMLTIPARPTLMLILMISKTWNISYDWSRGRVRALGRHSPKMIFDVKNIAMISPAWICTRRGGRFQFEWPWRDSTKQGGAVLTPIDSKLWQYSGTRSVGKHSIMGLTPIRLNSDYTQHWYSMLYQRLKVYLHCLMGVHAFFTGLS